MIYLRKSLYFLLSYLLFSCVYEPEGEFTNPITPPDGSSTQVTLTPGDNPILLNSTTMFSFAVKPEGKGIYTSTVTYDGTVVKTAESNSGKFSFTLNPFGHPAEGKLAIRVAYPSLSSSLAGQNGAEFVISETTWKVLVDVALPAAIEAPSVSIDDGKLMIKWQAPSKFNFGKLIVIRNYPNGRADSIKVADIHDTSVEDKTYGGGPVTYSVDMRGVNYLKGKETAFNCNPVTLTFDNRTGIVSWERPLLYNSSRLTLNVGNNYFPITTSGTYNPFVRFGEFQLVKAVTTASGMTDEGRQTVPYELTIVSLIGVKIPEFERVSYLKNSNSFLLANSTEIFRIDANSLSITNRTTVPRFVGNGFILSKDEQYAYMYSNENFFAFNPSSLNVIETTSFNSLVGFNQGISSVSIANGNLLAVGFYGASKRSYIIDMNTKSILFESSSSDPITISPEGKYIVQGTEVFTRGNNTWNISVGRLPETEFLSFYSFREDDNSDFLYAYGGTSGKTYVFNLKAPINGNLESTYEFPSSSAFRYDYSDNTISLRSGNQYNTAIEVYDADSHLILNTFTDVKDQAYYVAGNLFHPNGYLLQKKN